MRPRLPTASEMCNSSLRFAPLSQPPDGNAHPAKMPTSTLLHSLNAIIALTFVLLPHAASAAAAPRPNIIVIFTDDQGYHNLGVFGSKTPSPRPKSEYEYGIQTAAGRCVNSS